MSDVYVVIIGNLLDGVRHYGPFDDFDVASDWADRNDISSEWWVAGVESPENRWIP